MNKRFKLTPSEIKYFHDLVKFNKEHGGVINIDNGKLVNKTKELGGNYSVSYNQKNSTYEYSYHSHAYYPTARNTPKERLLTIIRNTMKYDMNKALYLFECDIMKVHPPSPQDCYVLSLGRKQGMLVCAQEGMYQLHYTRNEPITMHTKDEIDRKYYKFIWGKQRQAVLNQLQSGNHDTICKCLKGCMEYRKTHKDITSVGQYIRYLKTKGVVCKLIPWHQVPNHVFFSNV